MHPAHILAESQIALFEGLGDTDLAELTRLLQVRELPAGAHLILEDTHGETTFIIARGAVKIEVLSVDGTEVILAILGPGEIVGEMSVVDSMERSASVVTMGPTTLYTLDRRAFWRCLQSMPALTYNVARILSRRLREANAHVRTLVTLDVEGRVAQQLLRLSQACGEDAPGGGRLIPIRLTQTDLAGLVGASRVRVNQILSMYRQEGLVTVECGHRFLLHDPAGLAERSRHGIPPRSGGSRDV